MNEKYKPIQISKQFSIGALNYHGLGFMWICFWVSLIGRLKSLITFFDEVNAELLRCMVSLNGTSSSSAFNIEDLVKLAEFYPRDFEFK